MIAQQMSGPLPPAEEYGKYEGFLPGSAERILSMAERQSTHRQNLETAVVHSNILNERIGIIFGFIICLMAIGGGLYLANEGKSLEGLSSIVMGLASPAGVFIYGKSQQLKTQQARQQGVIDAAQNYPKR